MPLIVKPISANLTKDYDLIGRSDPYCIIFVGNQKQRSRTCRGGGKRPTWSDTFQFNSNDRLLRIQVWDDDTFSDDFIGEGTLTLNQFYQNPMRTENQYVDLISKGRSVGRVLLSVEYQAQMGGWSGNQGGWGGNQGGWGGNQGGWGGNQGGWGCPPPPQGGSGYPNNGWGNPPPSGNQGNWNGWGNPPPGYGGNQGGWNGWGNPPPGTQGGWNGWGNPPPGYGGNQGGWNGW